MLRSGLLAERQIIFRRRIDIQTAVPNAANNSDNRQPFHVRLSRVAKRDPFPKRVFVWPIFFRQRIIDDHHERRIGVVGSRLKKRPRSKRGFQHSK